MNLIDLIVTSAPYLISFLTGAVGIVIGRKRNALELAQLRAAADSSELDNVDKAIGIYRNIAEDLQKQIIDLKEEIMKLRDQNKALYKQNGQLMKENVSLKEKLDTLEVRLNKMYNG